MQRKALWLIALVMPFALAGCILLYAIILSPREGDQFTLGQPITFQGTARDAVAGVLNGRHLVWTSSIFGEIGTGDSFTVSNLPVGDHTITLRAQGPLPFSGSGEASVHIKVVRDTF